MQDSGSKPEPRKTGQRLRFIAFVEAARFMLPLGRPRAVNERVDIVPYIVPIGLLIGLIWAGTFRLAWWLYGETTGLRLIPSLSVVLIECLITGPFLALGLARTIHVLATDQPELQRHEPLAPLSSIGTLVLCLVILSEFALILSIQQREGWWPAPDDWRSYFNFMYPRPIYRPLLLAPLWGRWGLLLAATIGNTGPTADSQVVAINRSMTPGRFLKHALLPLVLTAVYCSRSRNIFTGLLIGILVFAVTYLMTVAFVRRGGGQTRQTLFAAAQVSQLAFLAIYRACWRLIDA